MLVELGQMAAFFGSHSLIACGSHAAPLAAPAGFRSGPATRSAPAARSDGTAMSPAPLAPLPPQPAASAATNNQSIPNRMRALLIPLLSRRPATLPHKQSGAVT